MTLAQMDGLPAEIAFRMNALVCGVDVMILIQMVSSDIDGDGVLSWLFPLKTEELSDG